jgi:hypothetical protein
MPSPAYKRHARVGLFVSAMVVLTATCATQNPIVPIPGDTLAMGTWGGDNAGLVVDSVIAHVHIGCTLGNFPAPVTFETAGRFNVAGSYVLRAYPVHIGPDLPAQFAGQVEGNRLTLTVTVNDTVEKKIVTVGPVTVSLGREPRLGPCPICRRPGEMASNARYERTSGTSVSLPPRRSFSRARSASS